LMLFLLYIPFCVILLQFMTINDYQQKTKKLLSMEAWWRSPGELLAVKPTKGIENSFDILIAKEFVSDGGGGNRKKKYLDTCKHRSLRKSIESTVQEHIRRGKYGDAIQLDGNRDEPRYLLHGWPEPYDPQGDEMWFTHARTATWAAIYSWTGWMVGGWTNWTQRIDFDTAPDVFGYIYLFEVANPNFYNTTEEQSRIVRVGWNCVNAPDHTPATEHKIFARYGYKEVKYMGDFPPDDPDAYIFKGDKVMKEANLKVLQQYRVMKPSLQ